MNNNLKILYKRFFGKNIIFVHINKNAGTTITNSINQDSKLHLNAQEYYNFYGERIWRNSFKFSVVRNPYTRVVSLYEYRKNNKKTNLDFNSWVEMTFNKLLGIKELDTPKFFQTQYDWLKVNNQIDLNYLCYFENLENDWEILSKKLKIKSKIGHFNKGNYKKDELIKDYYSTESKKIIEQYFKIDFKYFKYSIV